MKTGQKCGLTYCRRDLTVETYARTRTSSKAARRCIGTLVSGPAIVRGRKHHSDDVSDGNHCEPGNWHYLSCEAVVVELGFLTNWYSLTFGSPLLS